ncbi:MAG: hypothetical protein DA446_05215 [Bacteroidetes bacterium]|nr:MAG: hypothetical protein DA443_09200 [Bacteroidota bacterium]PTM20081.1 MAG: hypothetical protein DA446_05215 [Bacteroidota bacterium]
MLRNGGVKHLDSKNQLKNREHWFAFQPPGFFHVTDFFQVTDLIMRLCFLPGFLGIKQVL